MYLEDLALLSEENELFFNIPPYAPPALVRQHHILLAFIFLDLFRFITASRELCTQHCKMKIGPFKASVPNPLVTSAHNDHLLLRALDTSQQGNSIGNSVIQHPLPL